MAWVLVSANDKWNVGPNSSGTFGRALVNKSMYLVVTDVTSSDPTNVLSCALQRTNGAHIYIGVLLTYYNGFKFLSTVDETCSFIFDNLSAANANLELYVWQ